MFGDNSTYVLGEIGLHDLLRAKYGDDFDELIDDFDFLDEPRRLDEILAAAGELFDRVW